jgi:hypothetical protein
MIFPNDNLAAEAHRLAAGHRERIAKEKTAETRASLCRKLVRRLQSDLAENLRDNIQASLKSNASLVTAFAFALDAVTEDIAATPKSVAAPILAIGSIESPPILEIIEVESDFEFTRIR